MTKGLFRGTPWPKLALLSRQEPLFPISCCLKATPAFTSQLLTVLPSLPFSSPGFGRRPDVVLVAHLHPAPGPVLPAEPVFQHIPALPALAAAANPHSAAAAAAAPPPPARAQPPRPGLTGPALLGHCSTLAFFCVLLHGLRLVRAPPHPARKK